MLEVVQGIFDIVKNEINSAPVVNGEAEWISVKDRLPDIKHDSAEGFIVSVYRKHNNKSYSFAAYYLNDMQLDDDGNGDQVSFSGWHHQFKHDDCDEYYESLHFAYGDSLTHWMPLPTAQSALIESEKQ